MEIRRRSEPFEGEAPFLASLSCKIAISIGCTPLGRFDPKLDQPVKLQANLPIEPSCRKDNYVVDLAIGIGVLGQPKGMTMLGVAQWLTARVASRNNRRRPGSPTTRGFVLRPTELGESR